MFIAFLAALLLLHNGGAYAAELSNMCCAHVDFEPAAGTVSPGRSVADNAGALAQSLALSPWRERGWWFSVEEHRVSDGRPYDAALVLLNSYAGEQPPVTGRSSLVLANGTTHAGLAAFQVYPGALRTGTTNYVWHADAAAPATYVRSVRVHRSIESTAHSSVRITLKRHDGSIVYENQWLYTTSLTTNVVTVTLPIDAAHGPMGTLTLSFWGSGYSALGALELCQPCSAVTPTPSASMSATTSAAPTATSSATPSSSITSSATPSSSGTSSPGSSESPTRTASLTSSPPPAQGSACVVPGALGVCALGTWQATRCVGGSPAHELCDGIDNDCDGLVDEDFVNRTVSCGLGACRRTIALCFDGRLQHCTPGAPERDDDPCDGVDNNCNGQVDEMQPMLTCGVGACHHSVPSCVDGTQKQCFPLPASLEVCDGEDNDCDGAVDEDNVCNRPVFARATGGVLPVARCVTFSEAGLCTAHWDVVRLHNFFTTPEALDVEGSFFVHASADDARLYYEDGPSVPALEDGEYRAGVASTQFTCSGGQVTWLVGEHTSALDAWSERCPDSDNALPALTLINGSSSSSSMLLRPTIDSCVHRQDGYCNVTLGYYLDAPNSLLALAAGTTLNTVVVHGSTAALTLEQNQPSLFYPGRVRNALLVRAECPQATLTASWAVEWRLAGSVARATAAQLCVDNSGTR